MIGSELVKLCEDEAKKGLEAFGTYWMSLSQEDRKSLVMTKKNESRHRVHLKLNLKR